MQSTIREFYNVLLVPRYRYADSTSQIRARVTLLFGILAILISAISLFGLLAVSAWATFDDTLMVDAVATLVVALIIVGLVNIGYVRSAAFLLFIFLMVGFAVSIVDGFSTSLVLLAVLPVLFAGMIWYGPGMLTAILIEAALIIRAGILLYQRQIVPVPPVSPDQAVGQTLLALLMLLVVGLVSGACIYELRRALVHANHLLVRLRATAEVASQSTSVMTDSGELLKRTVNYIRDRFAFYRVQIFLVDPDHRMANLAASTDPSDDVLVQRGYRLTIGLQSAIGRVILTGEPIMTDAADAANRAERPAHEAPGDIRSELAVPLVAGDQMVGVLNMQSSLPRAFNQEDIDSLLIIATHVGIAIRNAQLFEEQRAALNENRRLFLEAELNLREIQRLNQRLTGQAWQEFLTSRNLEGIGYTLANNQLRADLSWTPVLKQAAGEQRPIFVAGGDRQTVAVPVMLRGRVIGGIEVDVNTAVRQADALEMLQAVAERLALSIDNARLFEQSQDLAQQELEVNAISAKLQGITDVNGVIEMAVDELGRVLGATQASIRLGGLPQRRIPNGKDGGKDNSREETETDA